MSEIKVGDRVQVTSVVEGDEAALGVVGTVSSRGLLFDLVVTLDEPVVLQDETFAELYLDEDEVELLYG